MCAGYVPSRSLWKKPPRSPMLQRCSTIDGSHAISLSLNPGIELDAVSLNSLRSTQASTTGYRDQIFGPRRVSILRISISRAYAAWGLIATRDYESTVGLDAGGV